MTDWDWETQRADTEAVWSELAEKYELPHGMAIALDLQFVAGDAPDKPGFVAALRNGDYSIEIANNEEGVETIAATTQTTFDPHAIWEEEERATRIALDHGYLPDGWGFWEPEPEDT